MPYLELPTDLAEAIADMLGISNQHVHFADTCACRQCWTGRMVARIRNAVANERTLQRSRDQEGAL